MAKADARLQVILRRNETKWQHAMFTDVIGACRRGAVAVYAVQHCLDTVPYSIANLRHGPGWDIQDVAHSAQPKLIDQLLLQSHPRIVCHVGTTSLEQSGWQPNDTRRYTGAERH